MKPGLHVLQDKADNVAKALKALTKKQTLVGIPGEKTDRSGDDGQITNAALGYIHDNGAPEAGIPARPWTEPGIKRAAGVINTILDNTGDAAFDGRPGDVDRGFEAIGMAAASAMKAVINEGIAPPLAESTLRKRAARGRSGAAKELALRAAGKPPSVTLAKPLIDTAQMRNAISYVVREK